MNTNNEGKEEKGIRDRKRKKERIRLKIRKKLFLFLKETEDQKIKIRTRQKFLPPSYFKRSKEQKQRGKGQEQMCGACSSNKTTETNSKTIFI